MKIKFNKFFAAAIFFALQFCVQNTFLFAQTQGTFPSGVTWALSSNGTLTISGKGQMPTSMSGGSQQSGGAFQPWESVRNNITSVIIEDGVTGSLSIGAFAACSNLTQVTLGRGITELRGGAFRGTGITSIVIPEQIVRIELDAFTGANRLEKVYYNAVNCADMGAILDYPPFHGTKTPALQTIVIGDKVLRIPEQIFSIGMEAFSGTRITELTIPQNVSRIRNASFGNSTRLKKVYFNSANCQNVDVDSPFSGCGILESIIFGDNVRQIPQYIAAGLNGLYTVTIGSRVNTIGYAAFMSCVALEEVTNKVPRPLALVGDGNAIFNSVDTSFITLRVPSASLAAYKTANIWKDFQIVSN